MRQRADECLGEVDAAAASRAAVITAIVETAALIALVVRLAAH